MVTASGIVWRNVLCVAADRAATNKDAFNIITSSEPTFVGLLVGCVPHTFSHVGEKSDLKVLTAFVKALTATLVSTNSTNCFKKHFGESQQRHSNVRWHCEFEQCTQVALRFPCLQPYMLECEQKDYAPESIKAMRDVVAADGHLLRCELAINMDALLPFVNATFFLEGDGVLCFAVTDKLEELDLHVTAVRAGRHGVPNTLAVARDIVRTQRGHLLQAAQDQDVAALVAEQLAKVEPSFVFYEARKVTLKEQFDVFEACRVFDPTRVGYLQGLPANDVSVKLSLFPFFSAAEVQLLVNTWPAYLVYVNGHPPVLNGQGEVPYEAWWTLAGAAGHAAWFEAAKKVMILTPSSAAAERVFSMLKALIGDNQQASALEDYQQTSIMLHYNQLQRYKAMRG